MKNAVVVFAKTIESGGAKSRIAEEAGREEAGRIYLELLEATARTVHGFDHFVSYLGNGGPGGLKSIFPAAAGFLPQKGADLGERLRLILGDVKDRGYECFCAIGTDCPDLAADDLGRVFALLEEGNDVVIGPACDGGYYLIAVKDPDNGVFGAEGWGRSTLLAETLAIVARNNLRHVLLPQKEDIDTVEAYQRWRPAYKKEKEMTHDYYEADDLKNFPNISELAPELGRKFFDYYESATSEGRLTEREKSLIALAVAHTERCPYCIDAFTNKCLGLGVSKEEMMEAVHVGAVMQAGVALVHATQMKKIAEKKEM